ncbi:MAG TPA: cytochrome c oxidase assembly protein, partial [Pseudomonas sp.]|nr:cytochrome c oxidase assembly protein [Pseudomonas sp.]
MPMTLWRCLLILALAWTTPALALDRDALLDEANVLLLPRERVIPPLTLIDQDGQPFDTRSLQGRWHILFFGFTACPDICPTTLSDMRRLFGQLPSDTRERLQLVLITADPARDTPQQLK